MTPGSPKSSHMPCPACGGDPLPPTDGPDGREWPVVCGACTPSPRPVRHSNLTGFIEDEPNERSAMSARDSRTDEQRQAERDDEAAFHKQREEAGLPPVKWKTITIDVRDVTDDEAQALASAALGVVTVGADKLRTTDRTTHLPHVAGGTVTDG